MKKIVCTLLVFSVVIFSGCSFSSTNKYLLGSIEGLLPTGTLQEFNCSKVGNIVTVSARYYDLENEPTNISCFQLPEGFRPKVNTSCNGYIVIDKVTIPTFVNINTDGVVSIAYSNSQTMSQIYFSATFPA